MAHEARVHTQPVDAARIVMCCDTTQKDKGCAFFWCTFTKLSDREGTAIVEYVLS
jgi:hypothetical protein